jgi:hypothetical protein
VCSAEIAPSDMPAEMNGCVLALFQRDIYPAPGDGCVDATVPMTLRPQSAPP